MAFKIVVLSILLTTVSAGPHSSHSSNSSSQFNNRIVDGQDAQVGEFPYLVSLQQGQDENSLDHNCGGSIISKDWILTAAHCVRGSENLVLFIKAGKHDLSKTEDSEQLIEVADRIVHDKYQGEVQPYDIALLKLKTPLELNEHVATIDLPQSGDKPSGQATIAGWGSVSKTEDKDFPTIMQKAQVPILDNEACQKRAKDTVVDTNVCTGTSEGGGTGACQGDSGGPLISNKQVIGITSWVVMPCGEALSVFTKVSDYVDWISGHMK